MSGFIVRYGVNFLGVQQAQVAGMFLAGQNPTSLRTGTFKRDEEASSIIGKFTGLVPEYTSRLDTLNIGTLSKLPEEKAEKRIVGYMLNSPNRKLPRGQSAYNWLQQIWPELQCFFVQIKFGKTPVIVTHGRVAVIIQALIAGNCKILSKEIIQQWPIQQKPGEIYRVGWNGTVFSYDGPMYEAEYKNVLRTPLQESVPRHTSMANR